MSQPTSRQELYDRIRQSSKDEVILEEMVRLGFWSAAKDQPSDPAEEIRRRGELERRLRALQTERSRLGNIEALKREMRKQRLAESRRKREETKERRLRERAERAAAWRACKGEDIVYLGAGVSGGLGARESDLARLGAAGLPVMAAPADVARAMGIAVGELRFLAFSRVASRTTHYARFTIPKRTGGVRLISAPMPRLKRAQRWVLDHVLNKLEPHPAAHGFRVGRSIVTNARPHIGAEVVVNLDLKDFFPTVRYGRVKGLFRHMGYSEAVATILALMCTEPEVVEVELDGVTYHVAAGERVLPQGAPTSPAVTNLLCRRMDRRLEAASGALGFVYTRYADDLTFSGSGDALVHIGRLLRQVTWIVEQEGFFVHPDKTRVLRRSQRQEVTGVVVNERASVPRDVLRRFRATLFQIERDGPEGKRWGQGGDVLASIVGFASYVAMVDAERGRVLLQRARAVAERHGQASAPARGPGLPAPGEPQASPGGDRPDDEPPKDGGPPKKKWWKIF